MLSFFPDRLSLAVNLDNQTLEAYERKRKLDEVYLRAFRLALEYSCKYVTIFQGEPNFTIKPDEIVQVNQDNNVRYFHFLDFHAFLFLILSYYLPLLSNNPNKPTYTFFPTQLFRSFFTPANPAALNDPGSLFLFLLGVTVHERSGVLINRRLLFQELLLAHGQVYPQLDKVFISADLDLELLFNDNHHMDSLSLFTYLATYFKAVHQALFDKFIGGLDEMTWCSIS